MRISYRVSNPAIPWLRSHQGVCRVPLSSVCRIPLSRGFIFPLKCGSNPAIPWLESRGIN